MRLERRELVDRLERLGNAFVVAFIILLVSAAASLAAGGEAFANQLAEYAYYFLVVAVVLHLAALALEEKDEKERGGAGET
jgi:hypothetical protein